MSDGHGRSTEGFGLSRQQSVDLIVKTALEIGVSDPRQIAFMLATAQHETRNFQAPEEDFGRSQARKLHYRGGEDFYGRGYVHLTHKDNYEQFDKLLGIKGELVKHPELAKNPELAAKIMVIGMRDGLFTGKPLDRYIDSDSHDLYNARRVVNGVNPARPWSVTAAKDCQEKAQAWEKLVPSLIENVKKNGVDLKPSNEPVSEARGRGVKPNDVLREGEKGPEVQDAQAQLAKLGYTGTNGKALVADSNFGKHSKHAVEDFQRAHGLHPVDGVVGKDTFAALEQAKKAPLVSEATHPDNKLFQALKDKMPGIDDAQIGKTLQATKEAGITSVDKLKDVTVDNGNAFVTGTTPGFRTKVDLNQPAPSLQETTAQISPPSQDQTQAQTQTQQLQGPTR